METKLSYRQTQKEMFTVLQRLDALCKELNLTYFLAYGTMLGAVRHHGIIPWDDDIDIMMPRADYDKLVEYCAAHAKELAPYQLFENSIDPDYPHTIARFSDSRYRLDFENEKEYGLGLFVDIYPLDGAGNEEKGMMNKIKSIKRNSSMAFLTSRKGFGRDNTHSNLKMAIKFPAYIWANLMGNAHYQKKVRKACLEQSYDDSKYVAVLAIPVPDRDGKNRNLMPKEWLEPLYVDFEDGKFPILKAYDAYLTMNYGEYMQEPDEVGKQPHHSYDTYRKDDQFTYDELVVLNNQDGTHQKKSK